MDASRSDESSEPVEVFEHIPRVDLAAREALRVARRWLLVTVPSKPDHNPEHVHYFAARELEGLLSDAGATSVRLTHVLNHRIALAAAPRSA